MIDNARTENWNGQRKFCDFVYDSIFELIVTGEFAEAARLPTESALCQRFEVSRPVVREALTRLRDHGLIQSKQGSGSFVTRRPNGNLLRFVQISSVSDIQRCYDFRLGFEAASARLAAKACGDDELRRLRDTVNQLDHCIAAGELGADADAAFHGAVAYATRNPYHILVQDSLTESIKVGMNIARNLSLLHPPQRLQIVQQEHIEIFRAIEARRADDAAHLMVMHIENARKRVFDTA